MIYMDFFSNLHRWFGEYYDERYGILNEKVKLKVNNKSTSNEWSLFLLHEPI